MADKKTVWMYDAATGEYAGACDCPLDPLESENAGENVWLLPAHCAEKEPGDARTGYAQIWNGAMWKYVEDHRGQIFYLKENGVLRSQTMQEIGALPEGALTEMPAPEPPSTEELFVRLRGRRNAKLRACDAAIAKLNRQARANPDDEASIAEQIAAWDAYAQALCDLPAQEGAPWDGGEAETPWPTAPGQS